MDTTPTLAEVRTRAVLTQGELAKLAKISRGQVIRLEAGASARPRPSTVRKLAAALHLDAPAVAAACHASRIVALAASRSGRRTRKAG